MNGRVRAVLGRVDEPLTEGWQLASTPPGQIADPEALARADVTWLPVAPSPQAGAPSTAAAALRAAKVWSLDGPRRRFDGEDWWWRKRFPGANRADRAEPSNILGEEEETALCFDGLATIADVWLNGVLLVSSTNMFVAHRVVVDLAADNELVIRCRALDALLAARRPRPRWRAPMVEHQQLRWFRATLLGRTPGWSPPAAVVGPWRPIRLERSRGIVVDDVTLRTSFDGDAGVLHVACQIRSLPAEESGRGRVTLALERGGTVHRATLDRAPASDDPGRPGATYAGRIVVPRVERWWPHTHGEPALYRAHLSVSLERDGRAPPVEVDLGAVGFREVALDTGPDHRGFGLRINGVPVFCRGACWTPLDPVSLAADPRELEAALDQVRDSGMNMLRVSGTMVYESDDFYDAADAKGILIWQDFMFANMDYPEDDPAFARSVDEEARQVLKRLAARPSLAVLCGNSEVEQQAAMWGASRDRWEPPLFRETLAARAAEVCPDVPYWPSSAHGGAFPHQADVGTSSYYGVGAYQRALDDARRAEVRFASECLAFANVPDARALDRMPGGESLRVHHPAWKERAPRDLGAGWDFDDVRDHYVARLFHVDPATLRYADHERYLALGRVATGEIMAAVFGEWRRKRSTCRGGLVWFLRDLWPGAGWGIVDAGGEPKAAYHFLRRALQPTAVHISDEGGNGLAVHVVHDGPAPLVAELEIALFRAGEIVVGRARRPVEAPPHGALEIPAAAFFEGFLDLNHAYRFGPPPADLVVASLTRDGGEPFAQAFHVLLGASFAHAGASGALRELDLGLTASARPRDDGDVDLVIATRRFARAIHVDVEHFRATDNHFHLAPGGTRTVRLHRLASNGSAKPLRGTLQPLNAESATKVTVAT
ncbi:glycosyl hydrolase 2 galactose-binding domain-containing protein [Pendulispora albinea]|uniref:beta-mannosidase n=1 Tax=Pendulispora albinea TaxID=2741071 RepID=A0ABZ2M6Y6_9BACT